MTLVTEHYWGVFQNLTSNLGSQSVVHAPTLQNTKPKQNCKPKNMKTAVQYLKQKLKNKQQLLIIQKL
jgi:hypothetical protein